MSLTVRDKFLWQQMTDEKMGGMGSLIPGIPHFVVPGASATHFAFMKDRHKRVYTSAALALADCVASRGDAIIFAPGAHTVSTASLAASKAGVRLFGPEAWMGFSYPGMKSSASITTDIAGDQIANFTAADCAVIGLTIIPITAADAFDISAAADRTLFKDCWFDMETAAASTSTVGVTGAAADHVVFDGCTFVSDGAQGNGIVATGLINSFIHNCTFVVTSGTWASAILCGAATNGLKILKSRFQCYGTALTAGVNGTGATIARGVYVEDCRFSDLVTVAVDNFDAGECEIAENYQLGIGVTDGGVLVVAIT